MLFTPDDQLRNMLSAAVGQSLKKGPNAAPLDNAAEIISLQGLLGTQATTPVPDDFLNDDWMDF
jgi:hypothetical protein